MVTVQLFWIEYTSLTITIVSQILKIYYQCDISTLSHAFHVDFFNLIKENGENWLR